MKKYLMKIFEKIQNEQLKHRESPDPLTEHSNSVQEQSIKKTG
jgi:hypothetical protein